MSVRCEILKSLIMSRAADSVGVSVPVPSRLFSGFLSGEQVSLEPKT